MNLSTATAHHFSKMADTLPVSYSFLSMGANRDVWARISVFFSLACHPVLWTACVGCSYFTTNKTQSTESKANLFNRHIRGFPSSSILSVKFILPVIYVFNRDSFQREYNEDLAVLAGYYKIKKTRSCGGDCGFVI